MTTGIHMGYQLEFNVEYRLFGSTFVVLPARTGSGNSPVLQRLPLLFSSVPVETFWSTGFDGIY